MVPLLGYCKRDCTRFTVNKCLIIRPQASRPLESRVWVAQYLVLRQIFNSYLDSFLWLWYSRITWVRYCRFDITRKIDTVTFDKNQKLGNGYCNIWWNIKSYEIIDHVWLMKYIRCPSTEIALWFCRNARALFFASSAASVGQRVLRVSTSRPATYGGQFQRAVVAALLLAQQVALLHIV